MQGKVFCKQCSSSDSCSHVTAAPDKPIFFHIPFDTAQTQRHTVLTSSLQGEPSHSPRGIILLPWAVSSIKKHTIRYSGRYSSHIPVLQAGPHPIPVHTPELQSQFTIARNNVPLCKCSLLPYRQHRLTLWGLTGTASIPVAQLCFPAQSQAKARLAVTSHDNPKG